MEGGPISLILRLFVVADPFDQDGSEIHLRRATDHVAPGVEDTFATVVAAARRRGEVATGYRRIAARSSSSDAYGVTIDPPKSDRLTLGIGDSVIVLAE
jgi:hypothetical protein